MNIDNLTIGQLKDIQSLLSLEHNSVSNTKKTDIYSRYIGKYVICRTRNEGVNAGTVIQLDETGVILADARRLYYHEPINKKVSWYEGVAKSGISKNSKVGTAREKLIVEDYSLTVCTEEAEKSIKEQQDHEQS
jgi:hypothetical protein